MKIAFDHQAFCINAYGGIARYFVKLAESLLSAGEEVGVFAPVHRNQYLATLPDNIVHGIKINYPLKAIGLSRYCNSIVGQRFIRQWQPQIVHETYYTSIPSAPSGCPTVLTVYDMIHELYPQDFKANDSTSNQKRAAIERADHIVCISECTRNDLLHFFDVPENKISVVHLGLDRLEKINSAVSLSESKKFILYVGGRSGYKNFLTFIKSVAASGHLKHDFDIVAFGGGKFNGEEEQLIKALGFKTDQIKQFGGGDDLLAELYEQASAFVFPSLYEGFGLPPLEAMAHQCPVISSNSSCMPEVIGNAAEFFDPQSIDDMTQAIENVLYSNERAAALKFLGQQRIEKFSWRKCASETLEIYEKVVND